MILNSRLYYSQINHELWHQNPSIMFLRDIEQFFLSCCLKAFRCIWEIKEFQNCLEDKTIHRETMSVSVSQKSNTNLKVAIYQCSLPKVNPCMPGKPFKAIILLIPFLKNFQWMRWMTGSKKLLAKTPKLHVDRTISYRHLTECLLSVVEAGDNESYLEEAVSDLL